jgi:hypothetical protein
MRLAIKLFLTSCALGLLLLLAIDRRVVSAQDPPAKKLDPAAWGESHANQPVPEYVDGDQCLFCHRNTIGPTWQRNAHGLTLRHRNDAPELVPLIKSQPALAAADAEIEYFLGSRHHIRFLKKDGYGKFAISSAHAVVDATKKAERWEGVEKLSWDRTKFNDRCAGCHATGVDSKEKTFAAFGLDCYTCHGVVDLDHTKDTSLILLAKKRKDAPRIVTSICAQCHLRGGKSQTSGLPYPNTFVAGDNLFKDFQADLANADDPQLNAGDRHIWRNVRDVVVEGKESVTCLNCHQIHADPGQVSPTRRHRIVLKSPICFECHYEDQPLKNVKRYTVKSGLCEY